MRVLIPACIDGPPAPAKDNVECILIPPENVLSMRAEHFEHLLGIALATPLVDVGDKQSTVEILRVRRQSEFPVIPDRSDLAKVLSTIVEARNRGLGVDKRGSNILHRQNRVRS